MEKQNQVLISLKEGITSGLPIALGYFPVAMAFGIISRNTSISLGNCCLFSAIVFAGASQFMAVDLIKIGTAIGNIILCTFLVNLRYLIMSAALAVRIKEIKKRWLFFIAFGVTDETFLIISLGNRKLSVPFLLALNGICYCFWVSGTYVGYLIGTILPINVQNSLGIGLYAIFIALIVPEIKKSLHVLILSIFSGILAVLFSYYRILPSSWELVATIIFASGMGAIFIKNDVIGREA